MEGRRQTLVALALAAVCLLVFGQTIHFGFINYDDGAYVTENPWVVRGITAEGVRWAFTTLDYDYWQPLSWLSHMLDCQFFGLQPGGHHLTNVLLHALNAWLAFAVLLALTGAFWRSAVAAAIFALHPMRLESVAWVAERKDLLGAFWFLAAVRLYVFYAARPSRLRYLLVIAAFTLGLMSKPVLLTLPFVLLMLDWWPLRRRAFSEKLPMFTLVGASCLITLVGTFRMGSINWGASLTFGQRLGNLLVSYVRYLELSVWPHDLAILYPFQTAVPWWEAAACSLLLAGITVIAVAQVRRRPYLLVGWVWFTVLLLPSSGLAQKGRQGMADRFTYLPHLGLALACVWGSADLLRKHRSLAAPLAVTVPVVFAVSTWMNGPVWRDSVSVFTRTVEATHDNPAAHHFLAAALDDQGRYIDALPHHAEAVRLEPSYFVAQCAYGTALEKVGEHARAIEHFRAALHYFPDYTDAKQQLDAAQKLLDVSKGSGLKLNSGQ